MDIWGVGCVFYEILTLQPLFPGKTEVDQVHKIHKILGTPSKQLIDHFKKFPNDDFSYIFPYHQGVGIKQLIPKISDGCIDLLYQLLKYDFNERITAEMALKHHYFRDLQEKSQKVNSLTFV